MQTFWISYTMRQLWKGDCCYKVIILLLSLSVPQKPLFWPSHSSYGTQQESWCLSGHHCSSTTRSHYWPTCALAPQVMTYDLLIRHRINEKTGIKRIRRKLNITWRIMFCIRFSAMNDPHTSLETLRDVINIQWTLISRRSALSTYRSGGDACP